jgi:hypothetical protein
MRAPPRNVNITELISACGSVVGLVPMIQAGRSRVRSAVGSFDFSVGLILAAALWPWGLLSL